MNRFPLKVLTIILALLFCCSAALAQTVPYTIKIGASTGIYQGPGVAYGYSKDVGEDGVYTIVEEAYDKYGNLWGCLKSGVGWVKLAEAEEIFSFSAVPYTVSLKASEKIYLNAGFASGYVRDVGEDGVYTIVEEAARSDGYLWGRLMSGAGWVALAEAGEFFAFSEVPYTVSLKAAEKIYRNVGSDSGYVKDVGEDGVYTIVEEAYDRYGNLWGRLKSGAGWVCLTEASSDYTLKLGAWVPVYSKPGTDDKMCVGIVGEDGVYTIVSEAADDYGNIWGELLSGRGWVNLNDVHTVGNPPITAYYADVVPLEDGNYVEYTADSSEYAVQIAFRANEPLNNVQFTALQYTEDAYAVEKTMHSVNQLQEDTYFVAGVVFYGDMTTYGVSFIDGSGEERFYAVSISGMDGSVEMNEYVP